MDADRDIYGIDFSGAKDAGDKIWLAKGVPVGGRLVIEECFRAKELPGSGKRVETCLPALVEWIEANENAVFGFDFPFGLPAPLVREKTWVQFVLAFTKKYKSPEAFREACGQAKKGGELKRQTDRDSRTPFSPYNLRLFRQTYYGLCKVLFPLVRNGSACVLPFRKPVAGMSWILEVCPASTLKTLELYREYKFPIKKDDRPETRSRILREMERPGHLECRNPSIREAAVADRHGDALDSIIAAAAAFKVTRKSDALIPGDSGCWEIEGYVYA